MVERVIILGIDGAGSFHSPELTPNVVSFLKSGTYCDFARAEFPTHSGENWGSILTGVLPQKHGVTNTTINFPYSEDSSYPTLFKLIHTQLPTSQLASVVAWAPINVGLIELSLPVFKQEHKEDVDLVKFLTESFIPKYGKQTTFLFVQLDSLDAAGHEYGYNSPEYQAQYKETDLQIGTILDALDVAGLSSSTMVIMTADHGGLHKDHGGDRFEEIHVLVGVRGPDVIKQQLELDSISLIDIAPTILASLRIDIPYNFDGKIIPIFK